MIKQNRMKVFNMKSLIVVSAVALLAVSCAAPTNISYFQDTDVVGLSQPVQENHIRLRPEDKVVMLSAMGNMSPSPPFILNQCSISGRGRWRLKTIK